MNYYDIMAALPTLTFGTPPPLSPEAFVAQCDGRMPGRDARELAHFTRGEYAACRTPFVKSWAQFEQTLLDKLAELRAGRWELDPSLYAHARYGRDDTTYLDRVLVAAFAKSNPRERERVLDEARWQELEGLVIQTPFGLAALLASIIKLRILTRWYSIHIDKGTERLNEVLTALLPPELPTKGAS